MRSLELLAGLASIYQVTAANPLSSSNSLLPGDDIRLPAGVPPKILVTDKPADPAGKLVKLRYGPFYVPAQSTFSALPQFMGGAKIKKPCEECWIGAFQGGLEFEDGSEANVDNGMYLHHHVIVNNNKPDWLCGIRRGGLFAAQYMYNSGNERPPVRLNGKYKFGMKVDKNDTFSAMTEIMNMSDQTRTVYTTLVYEVIPFGTPGYREATHLRIDIWQCGGSDVPAKQGYYEYHSPTFTSPYAGVILHNDGHGHGGTTEVHLEVNNKTLCNSTQYYGLRPRTRARAHPGSAHGMEEMTYISDTVMLRDQGRIEKGDKIRTRAIYNGTKYPQMVFKGHLEGQMGISFLYIGRDESTLKDVIELQQLGDQLPEEMGLLSAFQFRGGGPRPNATATRPPPPPAPKTSSAAPKSSGSPKGGAKGGDARAPGLLGIFGVPANASALLGGGRGPRRGGPDASFNWTQPLPWGPLGPGLPDDYDISMELPGLPKNYSLADIIGQFVPLSTLTDLVPGLPKDFKLDKLFVPGGIISSEIEPLMESLFGGGNDRRNGKQGTESKPAAGAAPAQHGHSRSVALIQQLEVRMRAALAQRR